MLVKGATGIKDKQFTSSSLTIIKSNRPNKWMKHKCNIRKTHERNNGTETNVLTYEWNGKRQRRKIIKQYEVLCWWENIFMSVRKNTSCNSNHTFRIAGLIPCRRICKRKNEKTHINSLQSIFTGLYKQNVMQLTAIGVIYSNISNQILIYIVPLR